MDDSEGGLDKAGAHYWKEICRRRKAGKSRSQRVGGFEAGEMRVVLSYI